MSENTKDDGGPAFARGGDGCQPQSGLTTRDYFAAAALMGLLSRNVDRNWDNGHFAENAYGYADAMLAIRNGKEK